ncbi:MAG TPA: YggT family protein [Gemmatimonadales bacterium]|nr:YggT family protein [Gemmatimonadales bacterium]
MGPDLPLLIAGALDSLVRYVVVAALAYAAVVALTHWAVRRRTIGPFGAWPRFVRRISDPVLLPLERRIVRMGGSPQDAPLWLLGGVIVAGLILVSLVRWLLGMVFGLAGLAGAGPRVWAQVAVGGLFSLLMAAILVRVIASWVGISPYSRWMRPVMALTDWLIDPIRRLMPPVGMIDLSPMVAWLVLWIARGVVLRMF